MRTQQRQYIITSSSVFATLILNYAAPSGVVRNLRTFANLSKPSYPKERDASNDLLSRSCIRVFMQHHTQPGANNTRKACHHIRHYRKQTRHYYVVICPIRKGTQQTGIIPKITVCNSLSLFRSLLPFLPPVPKYPLGYLYLLINFCFVSHLRARKG